jgi:hypothetical protein
MAAPEAEDGFDLELCHDDNRKYHRRAAGAQRGSGVSKTQPVLVGQGTQARRRATVHQVWQVRSLQRSRSDASGGIVFRFSKGRYYVIRANALEDNLNFYYYDRGRHNIVGVRVKAPTLGQWHRLRIVADGDRTRGWLNERPLIDKRDTRFASGRVGLWTKADSVTAFDDLLVRPL